MKTESNNLHYIILSKDFENLIFKFSFGNHRWTIGLANFPGCTTPLAPMTAGIGCVWKFAQFEKTGIENGWMDRWISSEGTRKGTIPLVVSAQFKRHHVSANTLVPMEVTMSWRVLCMGYAVLSIMFCNMCNILLCTSSRNSWATPSRKPAFFIN